jgi:hypothetical protein
MNGLKILLISTEACALILLFMLSFMTEVNCDPYTRATFIVLFAVVAVAMQSMQQNIRWRIDYE